VPSDQVTPANSVSCRVPSVARCLAASIFQVQNLISLTWGLGPQRADAVLLIATTMEPAKRLGSEAEGKAWLDAAAQVYAQQVGISLSSGGSGSTGGSSGGAVMNSEEFLKFQAKQHEFAYQQINLYFRYLKRDPRQGEILYDKEKASSAQIQAQLDSIGREHGDTYIEGIQPIFDALKARHFDSSWNWVRSLRDALAETCYFYAQNLPTIVTLLPRAGLALALLLSFFSPENRPGGLSLSDVDQSIARRDGTFFDKNTGALSAYAKGVLIANAAWAAWRTLILLFSWCEALLLFPVIFVI
jgi:3-oxoacyl-ACP reductase-like protein